MHLSRRTLLHLVALTGLGLASSGLAGCDAGDRLERQSDSGHAETDPAATVAWIDNAGSPASASAGLVPDATPAASASAAATPDPPSTPGATLSTAIPRTPNPAPPTSAPTPTPRPRPVRALLTVPYYSQHIGRLNYCLPTSIAMVADRYDRLPSDVSGTPDRAPRFVADVAYGLAQTRIAALDEATFAALWEEIGTDPLGGIIWDVFAPNGRDLAAGMSPALAYLVLRYAFGLTPILGTLDECLVALADDVPSILFGTYGALRRVDGMDPNVSGYTGDHAFVLVGIDHDRLIVNDPLPFDKTRYSGERGRASASLRAVRFELASVQRMTRGDGGEPRGDCFMVPPGAA